MFDLVHFAFQKSLYSFFIISQNIDTLISGLYLKTVILFNYVLKNKLQ